MNFWRCPRSVLFVPGDQPRRVEKALKSEADAICVDLEDAVAPQHKTTAREQLPHYVSTAQHSHRRLWVRLNSELSNCAKDLAALPKGIEALVLPKAHGWSQIQWVLEAIRQADGPQQTAVGLIPMVEDLPALAALQAHSPSNTLEILALALGGEDLAISLGVQPLPAVLSHGFFELIQIAEKVGVPVLGFPGCIAELQDLERLSAEITLGRQMGAKGAFCIHPKQLDVFNTVFALSSEEIRWAEGVMSVASTIEETGTAVHPHNQQMIDAPVLCRALKILARAKE